MKKMTYVSLFSGCGGFDEGFIRNDFECLGAFDIDPVAIQVFNKNIGPFGHVWDLSSGRLPYTINKSVDIVLSGSPCQGFSTVGKRQIDDPRNNLMLIGGKIAIDLDTKIFIAENVMGSTAGNHKVYWEKLEKMFKQKNYAVRFIKCDVRNLGLPQLRRRVIMVAAKDPQNLNFNLSSIDQKSLRDILGSIDLLPNHDVVQLDKSSDYYKIAKKIKPGQKLSNVRGSERSVHTWNIPEVFGKTTTREKEILCKIMRLRRRIRKRKTGDADPVDLRILKEYLGDTVADEVSILIQKGYLRKMEENSVDLAHTFNGKYRRLSFSMPSPTVDTRFGSPIYFLHPEEHRALTVREAARIQGFPDSFIFDGPMKKQYQMIGNAVPPVVSFEFARVISENFINHVKKLGRRKSEQLV